MVVVEGGPLIVKRCDNALSEAIDLEYRGKIEKFLRTLKKNFSEEYLTNFYDNINSVMITTEKRSFKDVINNKVRGCYSTDNSIHLTSNYSDSVLNHELLHLASTTVRDYITYIGFNQISADKGDIGRGLNEGYTEYLNKKYFNIEHNSSFVYDYLMNVSEILENITLNFYSGDKTYYIHDMVDLNDIANKYKLNVKSM